MFHISFIFLPFIFTILTITMVSSCPSELIINEPLSNSPRTNPIINDLIEDKILDDYLDQLTAGSQLETSSELPPLYSLLRQKKSFDTHRQRFKRPSWAAVGKRAASIINKRPSWAQVG